MTLKRKLVLVFDVVLLLAALQAGAAILLLSRVVEQSNQLVSPALDRVDALAHAEADTLRLRTLELTFISVDDPAYRARVGGEMQELRLSIQRHIDQYAAQPVDQNRAAARADVARQYAAYLETEANVEHLLASDGRDAALAAYLGSQPAYETLDARMHALRHMEYAATLVLHDDMVAIANRWRWVLVAVVVVVAVVDNGLGWYLSRGLARSLGLLREGAARIAREQFDRPIAAPPEPELAELAGVLNGTMGTLADSRAERERLALERQRLARERLADVVRAQEDERRRIARELHDQAAQALTGLRYRLAHLKRLSDDRAVQDEVDRLVEVSAEAGRQIAALARDLRPSVLDDLGLVPALRSYVREVAERTGLEVELSTHGAVPRLSSDAETAIFRVVQEALTNVAKHAQAEHAWVELTPEAEELLVEVRDDGRGFADPTPRPSIDGTTPSGLGLTGIRERIQLLEGAVQITSAPGEGTRILARVPIEGARPAGKAA
jgi:two-component system sensor histidine kinase UhpB